MESELVWTRSDPHDEGSSYGHLKCHGVRWADGTMSPGNTKLEKTIFEELEMENVEPSPGPIMSARSAEEEDTHEPDAIVRYGDSDWVD
eukprot:7943447-Heterocapsa_arctica.AAC.1